MDGYTNERWNTSTKTLSKVANHIAKKDKKGVVYLHQNIDEN